ncbi:MAG: hypothetical protein QOG54_1550 [Actinomycetota bacterium]|jgi:hypothetical protein|nr:hypothetical protein [Actinomycetota bacterium]
MAYLKKLLLVAFACLLLAGPAAFAANGPEELGNDPSGDGPPALDVTYLQVARAGKSLEVAIGVSGMFPQVGGYPEAPGIEWSFTSKGRTFVAEAVASLNGPTFYLFEEKGGAYEQLESPTGTYDHADGYIMIAIPLKTIGAKRGTVISGTGENDVDAHVHVGPQTYYADQMTTTKDYVIP